MRGWGGGAHTELLSYVRSKRARVHAHACISMRAHLVFVHEVALDDLRDAVRNQRGAQLAPLE